MRDADIDYSDIPPVTDEMWAGAVFHKAKPKKQTTLRLDDDVVEFFRAMGQGYQTRINAVLRSYMKAHQ